MSASNRKPAPKNSKTPKKHPPPKEQTWLDRQFAKFDARFDKSTNFVLKHPGLSRALSFILLFLYIAVCILYILKLEPGPGEGLAVRLVSYCPTVMALAPSLLALGHFITRRRRSTRIHIQTVKAYVKFRADIASRFCASKRRPVSLSFLEKPDRKELDYLLRRRPGQYLLGACALALPFLVLSIFSDALHGIRGSVAVFQNENGLPFQEGIRGLVFTGYGIYIYTLIVLLHRMHAEALSAEFLLGAALRALTMMLIGFMVGETGIFITQASPTVQVPPQVVLVPSAPSMPDIYFTQANPEALAPLVTQTSPAPIGSSVLGLFVYFAIGAFPFWGYEALRSKARKVLQPHATSEKIPLEYVDGLDEMIIERLEELGIGNAQHLATSDPVILTLRTNYPFSRIIDWINQAILITHLQDRIRIARELGIRGATDLRCLYEAVQKGQPAKSLRFFHRRNCPHCRQFVLGSEAERARILLQQLADSTRSSIESIYLIGSRLADDFHVTLLFELWQDRCTSEETGSSTKWPRFLNLFGQERGAGRETPKNR
ncbi:hypothetical protein [Archangium lansingense]|uniref:DUF2868 domain-containing protein n=1 Tax=Archangium lansingense TaxID=2995310 RepID=A0ABT4A3A2_9BACT|nr:hypothetical protein [Archangium lansinium]MCY1076125.1 hypothetical protein [Archangium lansinium]